MFMEKTHVIAEPGICGFSCIIEAQQKQNREVTLKISGSECEQIQRLSELLKEINFKELFTPITLNPVYVSAQQAGCHPSCVVPVAIIKAAEAAMGMAIPEEVRIKFC